MKFSLALVAAFAASASAFAPSPVERANTSLNMDRRAAAAQIATGAAVLAGVPTIALADGAVSKETAIRARGIYGQRIAALEPAVNAGDFGAVAAEKNAFILFNSGAIQDKKLKSVAVKGTNDIFAAIRAKDAAALKSAYAAYKSANGIELAKAIDTSYGQGYSSDFDFRSRTVKGTVYVR
mmetsp:Transcript_33143/g.68139  ORF Transcript_33143/g.68139 Transcript_33143/m.68139 type:complete len:181 (+) Transcript_33143:137-679(+)